MMRAITLAISPGPDDDRKRSTGASGFGMGVRSKRYAMIVEDGVVKTLNIEDTPGQAVASGAAAVLEAL